MLIVYDERLCDRRCLQSLGFRQLKRQQPDNVEIPKVTTMSKTVLFLCTGNYYRSRFAENLFNHLAHREGLDWRATSGGTATELGVNNVGPISRFVGPELERRGIALDPQPRFPCQVTESELAQADLIVALKEEEHRPHLTSRFPDWADRVTYWQIHDIDLMTPQEAFAVIGQAVEQLVAELRHAESATSSTRTIDSD
ncbi:MAG: low molecular weight protein-tyrosine phosphatase [Abditibacteriota bacterium]|nr:low molecular weight protein-tyrosine phosphatase [Abditibacteriota bacterium]